MVNGVNKQEVKLENGIYNALWSGFNMQIIIPNKENVYIETIIGIKGINYKTIVEIEDGVLNVVR